jgi:signal peptidase I
LIPILIIVLGYFTISFATGEPSPFTIVTGTSMQPTILAGSVAMLDKIPFDQLVIGEVIVFTPPVAASGNCDSTPGPTLTQEAIGAPCFVIHRIVDIQDTNGQRMIKTKGDNNPGSIPGIDFWINQTMYVGVVVFQLPVAGYITQPPYNEYLGSLLLALFVVELFWERKAKLQTKPVDG